jgi:hypothetical protein
MFAFFFVRVARSVCDALGGTQQSSACPKDAADVSCCVHPTKKRLLVDENMQEIVDQTVDVGIKLVDGDCGGNVNLKKSTFPFEGDLTL